MNKEQNDEKEECPELDFSFADLQMREKLIRDLSENDVPTNDDEYQPMEASGYGGGYGFYRYERPFEMFIFYCLKDIPCMKLKKGEIVILKDTEFDCNLEDKIITNMVVMGSDDRYDKMIILKDELMFLENIKFKNKNDFIEHIATYVFELVEENDLWKK